MDTPVSLTVGEIFESRLSGCGFRHQLELQPLFSLNRRAEETHRPEVFQRSSHFKPSLKVKSSHALALN